MQQLQNINYAIARTGLSKAAVYQKCREEVFPHVRVGRRLLFDPGRLEEWIEKGGASLPGGWRAEKP